MIIDTHAHLFLEDYDRDVDSVIENMLKNDVVLALMPNLDNLTVEKMLALESKYPINLKSMIGLHPCYIDENYRENLKKLEKYFDSNKFIGIGEVGLDRYHSNNTIDLQKKALEIEFSWAKSMALPLSIHAREAVDDVIQLLKKNQKGDLTGVFHCFSGTENQAKEIIDLGFYLGIGGTITYKNNTIRDFIKKIDYNYILLETDAPYLKPRNMKSDSSRNEPAFLSYILSELGILMEMEEKKLCELVYNNTKKLFIADLP